MGGVARSVEESADKFPSLRGCAFPGDGDGWGSRRLGRNVADDQGHSAHIGVFFCASAHVMIQIGIGFACVRDEEMKRPNEMRDAAYSISRRLHEDRDNRHGNRK